MTDESIILRFRRVLERYKLAAQILQTVNERLIAKYVMLKSGTVATATLIAVPSSTTNNSGELDSQMKQSRKGQQWHVSRTRAEDLWCCTSDESRPP